MALLNRLAAISLLLSLAACGDRPAAWSSSHDLFVKADLPTQAAECAAFKASLPKTVATGTLSVPEDWDDSSGTSPKINIFYYGQLDKSTKDPIVFFNGGPGADSHGYYEQMRKRIAHEKLDFIFIDQRGTGCSSEYPAGMNQATLKRLELYGTRAIVRDAEAVRKNLFGERTWKSFGHSFGSQVVHRYLEIAPEGLKAAYAHGFSIDKKRVMTDSYVHRLAGQKKAADAYFARYPEDLARWRSFRAALTRDVCFRDDQTRICGSAALDSTYIILANKDSWPGLHRWIEKTAAGPLSVEFPSPFLDAVGSLISKTFFSLHSSRDYLPRVVLSQFESNDSDERASSSSASEDPCEAAETALRRRGEDPQTWEINECRMFAAVQRSWSGLVVSFPRRDSVNLKKIHDNLLRLPALPFYLYAGKIDPLAPAEGFREEVEFLASRVIYQEFTDSAHEGFSTEPQVWKDLAR